MEERTETGRPVLQTLDWRRLCDICVKEEQTTGRPIALCRHAVKTPSAFRSFLDQVRVMALMRPYDNAGRTEMQNETLDDVPRPYFDEPLIEARIGPRAPRVQQLPPMSHFFIGLDPGSTVDRSDTGIVSGCYTSRVGGPVGARVFDHDVLPWMGHFVVRPRLSSFFFSPWVGVTRAPVPLA